VRLWLRMLACTNRIENFVRQNLQANLRRHCRVRSDGAARARSRAEDERAVATHDVTGGNVTASRCLEKEGLVVREVDATDRRVFHVKLSAKVNGNSGAWPPSMSSG